MNIMSFWNMSYGVYIVNSMDGDRPVGCIANSSMQITVEPATIAVSINKANYTHSCIEKSGKFTLNILPETFDAKTIGTFGFTSSKDVDKFSGIDYKIIEHLPVLAETCGHFICKVVNALDCGTHTVFLGEVVNCDIMMNATPMTYDYYHKVIKGRAPKTAPTYIPEELIKGDDFTEKYVCTVCSYEYDGDIPFEDLPDDYECPICSQGKSVFAKK